MIRRFDDEAAMVTDAYIDLLLDRRLPIEATIAHRQPLPAQMRNAIELLHAGLPRFHPSFLFEERLAARLHVGPTADSAGELISLDIEAPAALDRHMDRRMDRRIVLGGAALASGVSMAAVYAWRHTARRGRGERGVIA
jgi:hypothetical protein